MNPCEYITAITAVACQISKCCDDDDLAVLAATFTQLGDSLTTLLVARELNNSCNNI